MLFGGGIQETYLVIIMSAKEQHRTHPYRDLRKLRGESSSKSKKSMIPWNLAAPCSRVSAATAASEQLLVHVPLRSSRSELEDMDGSRNGRMSGTHPPAIGVWELEVSKYIVGGGVHLVVR